MRILDDIYNKNKEPLAYNTENNPVDVEVTQAQETKTQTQVEQPKYDLLPNFTQEEQDEVLKYIPYEELARYSKPYDPNSAPNTIESYYTNTVTKPSEIDEKKVRNAKMVAGIGDGLNALSQILSYTQGAYIQPRGDASALANVGKQVKDYYDNYQKLMSNYETGLVNAKLKDFIQNYNEYYQGRGQVQKVLGNYQTRKQNEAIEALKHVINSIKADAYVRNIDNQIANRDKTTKLRETQVATSSAVAAARINKLNHDMKNNGSKGYKQVIISANDEDQNAQTDQFGNKIVTYELSDAEVAKYSQDVKKRAAQDSQYAEELRAAGLYDGVKYADDELLASVYVQEHYDSQFPTANNNYYDDESDESDEDEFPVLF